MLVAIAPDGSELVAEGRVDGTIAPEPRGAGGFGYDPVFVPTGETRTFGEMTAAEKDGLSHRGRAAAALRVRPAPVNDDARRRAAALATGTSAVLIAAKVALALVTGSVAALAEATHAAAELLRTIVAAFAARDESRPGGTPATAGALEGAIVVVAGVVAAFASLRNLDGEVDLPLLGVAGLLACALLARLVAAHVSKVADATGSAALAADARSLRSSQATAILAAGALAVVALVDVAFPDAVGGLLISGVVVRVGVELIQAARPATSASAARSSPRSPRSSPPDRPRWSATAGSSAAPPPASGASTST